MDNLSKRGLRILLFAMVALLWVVVLWLIWNTWHAVDSAPPIQLSDSSPDGPYAEEYERVVDLVIEGSLCSENYGDCQLPEKYAWLSDTGTIWIDRRSRTDTTVFFWGSAGILGEG